jgi:hypothetical protein
MFHLSSLLLYHGFINPNQTFFFFLRGLWLVETKKNNNLKALKRVHYDDSGSKSDKKNSKFNPYHMNVYMISI